MFEQLRGAPAVAAFTEGNLTYYMEEHFEEMGEGKGRERAKVMANKAEKASEQISEMVQSFLCLLNGLQRVPHPLISLNIAVTLCLFCFSLVSPKNKKEKCLMAK